MKFIKLDLLTLLISLFLFASCEKTSTIGLEIDPNSAIQGALVDTLTISSRTVLDQNVSTFSLTRHPLGYLKDPIFGTTESTLSFAVNLPNDAYSFGINPVIDSAVLVLSYGSEFYGDSTSLYSFDVRQLSSNLVDAPSLNNNVVFPANSTLLGNKTTKVYPTTPIKISDVITGLDTLKTVKAQVRIKLDNQFFQNNVLTLGETSLKTNYNFTSAFKGLQVKINKTTSTGNGGLMFFDFAGTNSSLMLYYRKQNATTTTAIDTIPANFPISTTSGPVAATTQHDYTGTAIATQLNNPNQQYAVTYLQPLVGLRNKISFPYLNKFIKEVGNIVVNKAELVIDLSTGTDIQPLYAPRLSLYRYDIAEKRQNVPDNNSLDIRGLDPTVFGGYFNAAKKQYIFVVTSYIQDLMTGKLKDYGTFLAPTPSAEYSINPSLSSGARAVIGSFKKNPSTGDNIMKLNVYYTKIN